MQETCVLNFLPVIPQWKIYSLPSKKQVQYSFILKQKTEFQKLLLSALHSRNLKTSSCTIVDKRVCFPKKNKIIEIVFLNQVFLHNLLVLKLCVHEKYVVRRCNNILIFIKNIYKNVSYQVQNDCIYVKCDSEVQWNIFYNLFEFLFERNQKIFLGHAFYDSLICILMMKNEKDACIFLRANSDWQIPHCELEKQIFNTNCSKSMNAQNRDLKSNTFPVDNLSNYRKNVIISSQKPFNESSTIRMKRKLVINESDDSLQKAQKVGHCFCEKISCKCHNAKWKIFRNIPKHNVSNYLDILLSKGVLSDDEFCSTQENKSFNLSNSILALQTIEGGSSSKDLKSSFNSITDEHIKEEKSEICENGVSPNKKLCQNSDQELVTISTKERSNAEQVETLMEIENVANIPLISTNKSEFTYYQNKNVNGKKNDSFLCDNFSEFGNVFAEEEFDMFQTAAGKKVIVSETALQTAKKMFAEVFEPDNTLFAKNKSLRSEKLKVPANKQYSTKIITNDYLEENIDRALAEKIFEEISFDDKESESNSNMLPYQSPSVNAEKTLSRASSFGKVRKSLGGRRSLKPYST